MKNEWVISGGICFIIGLLCILIRSVSETIFFQFIYGSGFFLLIEGILAMFIGIASPRKEL